jgi:hypothetical protein
MLGIDLRTVKKTKLKPTDMQVSLKFKTMLVASLALLVISCNNDKSKKTKVTEVTLQDIKQEDSTPEPPPPPKVDLKLAAKRCFANDGLKYNTIITIYGGDNSNEVAGDVASEEIDSNKKETTKFEGTISGDKLTIKFKGTPPIIGDASEWTDKPWTIKKAGGKETLVIVFNAKNYDTNKWGVTDYQFAKVDCK